MMRSRPSRRRCCTGERNDIEMQQGYESLGELTAAESLPSFPTIFHKGSFTLSIYVLHRPELRCRKYQIILPNHIRMASPTAPPKSILKKTNYPATSSNPTTKPATKAREDRNRELAFYHANVIQHRKEVELDILLSMETLIDYPLSRSPPYSACNPSPTDASSFKTLLRPFQPSDYDDLITERNINEHCGYTLCPKPRVKDVNGGRYRLLGKTGKAKDFRIVERKETEMWCSEECARRALYVKVQLSESPAWEREANENVRIDLLDEPKEGVDGVVEGLEQLHLNAQGAGMGQDAQDLALERGDISSQARKGLVDVIIQEKDVVGPAQAPTLDEPDLSGRLDTLHLNLEGHTSTFGSRRERRHDEELEDQDTDWRM